MMYNSEKQRRRSLRLKGYNYTQEGAYFVTICTHNRKCIFGDIVDGQLRLNEFGRLAETEWLITENIRENVEMDEYIIMPNHMHGKSIILSAVGARCIVPLRWNNSANRHQTQFRQSFVVIKRLLPTK